MESHIEEDDYELSYKTDLEIYEVFVSKLALYDIGQLTESNKQPMHPNLYYQLKSVRGFTNLNGKTYNDYLEKWRKINI